MRALSLWPVDKELRIERDAAVRLGVEFHHPAVDPFRVKLWVDGPIQRIGKVDSPPVTAHFDHLRAAAELAVLRPWMRSARHDAADTHLAGELGIKRVRHIVLLQITGAPAGDV